jgi:hypothetical protein
VDVERLSLGSMQSTVGLVAGLISVTSAMYSAVRWTYPPTGQVVAVVRAARAEVAASDRSDVPTAGRSAGAWAPPIGS